ncbi:DUF1523 family protein [Leucobacter allii]|uniref:DUF1523 family protein n=1 Tax=Leucobacter allii TaxID=2932247 RepID=UPI001FD2817E|nr:DUF1523 family protein [Leucobacter allii]UOR02022.1 DUF1523 family protein [Leucobacter allii]
MRKLIAAVVAAGTLVGLAGCAQMNREQHAACTVEDKDRAIDSEGAPSYRVYTDCGVFTIADNLFEGQFNSADTYSDLEIGATYELETIGWRNGFLSLFPNIVEAKAVAQ